MPIKVDNLSFVYDAKAVFKKEALSDITLSIEDGDFVAIVGSTGSGKSTLVTHFNGLIKLQHGSIFVDDIDLSKKYDAKALRAKVGMVFQYPEYQLFADTVEEDVAFGPKNLGLDDDEIQRRVDGAIKAVGLDKAEIGEKSPFELSGGQMRRVAIAGVIAMKPEILILDEPTAGLDPKGKKDIMELIVSLKNEMKAVVMISHNMDEVAEYCNKVILLKDGTLVGTYTPRQLFATDLISSYALNLPAPVSLARQLKKAGIIDSDDVLTREELVRKILEKRGINSCVK